MSPLATLLVACVAAGVSFAATPLAGRLAGILDMRDRPSARKVHGRVIPYLGGLGILAGWLVAFVTADAMKESAVLLAGMTILCAVGFVDDRYDISERLRLVVQVGVAVMVFAGGIRMSPLDNVTGIQSDVLDLVLTVLWIVGITNAFNFMDNMDGLAAGVGGIAAASLGIVGVVFGQQLVSLLGFGLAGACVGFLRHNFHPARIFMGDTGSLPLGFGLAVLAVKADFPGVHPHIAFAVPVIVLGLFVLDTTVMTLGRILRREPVIGARLDHVSHRLLQRDLPVRAVALRLYGGAGLCGTLGVVVAVAQPRMAAALVALALVCFAGLTAGIVRWPIMQVAPAAAPPEAALEAA
ncbi:MAG: undecaprenyl/decaprenyl-phosphate alpha-N-acetylglucosaminyl 1-phosphate transferase [Actinomycetota bacterium]|nr:undecaprenyl/decaprenyl-phosphate alpha-N-acetylglucosaminyl 1-phosphate transferase [Actinomycetota bacterium]